MRRPPPFPFIPNPASLPPCLPGPCGQDDDLVHQGGIVTAAAGDLVLWDSRMVQGEATGAGPTLVERDRLRDQCLRGAQAEGSLNAIHADLRHFDAILRPIRGIITRIYPRKVISLPLMTI